MYAYDVSKTTVGGCQDFGGTPAIFFKVDNHQHIGQKLTRQISTIFKIL